MELSDGDRAMLSGEAGAAARFAMEILVAFAETLGAGRFLDISQAHVDGCLYHGEVSLDFVDRLVAGNGRVRVPTTLNVGSVDLIHPELVRSPEPEREAGQRLMEAHLKLGCVPSFTCAPYQTRFRPKFGEQIAWGESNAIVFANSVIGARTERYGDFIDLCCAITGRAPAYGLHLDEHRRGEVLFRLTGLGASGRASDSIYVGVGHIVGARSGGRVPVINGLPPPSSEDQLKALGAVAASSGSVALFHAVGITPEAPTLGEALGGSHPKHCIDIGPAEIRTALAQLSSVPDGDPIAAVSLGTPHFSLAEFRRLLPLLPGFRPAPGVDFFINTGRETVARLAEEGMAEQLREAGITLVADTCTYVTAVLRPGEGAVMTNSGKFAHYAPGNIGVRVAFGELEDCVASAALGRVVRRAAW